MNVKTLRELIEDLPDDYEVQVELYAAPGSPTVEPQFQVLSGARATVDYRCGIWSGPESLALFVCHLVE